MIAGDTEAALAFLQLWESSGPWLLSAIDPISEKIETRSLTDPALARHWIEGHQGRRNIYFSVNRPKPGHRGRAKKIDISEMLALHVDVDPPKDPSANLAAEQATILDRLKAHNPRPSSIIFSGGGYQGYWRLAKPELVKGRIEELEAYNRGLGMALGADYCHDIDRIMRVPGTINIPNRKKRAAGRVEALAELLYFDPSRVYQLADFTPAAATPRPVELDRSRKAFAAGAKLRRQRKSFEEFCEALRNHSDADVRNWLRDKGSDELRHLRLIWDKTEPSESGEGVSLKDFYAFMPQHNYIFVPTRETWPGGSVNALIPPVQLIDKNGNPVLDDNEKPVKLPSTVWLDRFRHVEQMTWCPGLPTVIKDRLIAEGGWIERRRVSILNLYRPPPILPAGDASRAQRWVDHIERVYPDESERIIAARCPIRVRHTF